MGTILIGLGAAVLALLLGVILTSPRFWPYVGPLGRMPQLLPKGWLRRHFGAHHPE